MSKKNCLCSIPDQELSKNLGISYQRLDEVVAFFDSDPDDEWDLVEGEDYEYVNRTKAIRKFSPRGALKIASYLDHHESRGLFYKIKEFVTRHDRRLRNSFAKKIIVEELSRSENRLSINARTMIHKQSLRRILETSGARLNQAFRDIQRSVQPMEPGIDYVEREQTIWFASSGAVKIAKELGESLVNPSRSKACLAVAGQFSPVLKKIESADSRRIQEIENAKKRAKSRAKKICQVTSQKPDKYNNFNLVAHHLFCEKEYPHLAVTDSNLIVIKENLHAEFHSYMGGTDKPCTIDDFIDFIHAQYPDFDDITIDLQQRKKALNPQRS